jgi:hypothetical protein
VLRGSSAASLVAHLNGVVCLDVGLTVGRFGRRVKGFGGNMNGLKELILLIVAGCFIFLGVQTPLKTYLRVLFILMGIALFLTWAV